MGRLKAFSPEEVAKHSKDSDLWVIINNRVYDVTKYAPDHPSVLVCQKAFKHWLTRSIVVVRKS